MTIEGKDADALFEQLGERDAKARADRLAAARAEAAVRGKQAFDLEALEQLVDTSRNGRLAPVERRRARFETMYYVDNPSLMSLAELAALIRELNSW
jgi:hypothetical protein